MTATVDFGAPPAFGRHHFYVDIPAMPQAAVRIAEDYGFDGDGSRETSECRIILARELWTKIRDEARRDFNTRLKAKKLSTGSWNTGTVKLERFLGRELCVLAWATEHAIPDECPIICQKWRALPPGRTLVAVCQNRRRSRTSQPNPARLAQGLVLRVSRRHRLNRRAKKTPQKPAQKP